MLCHGRVETMPIAIIATGMVVLHVSKQQSCS